MPARPKISPARLEWLRIKRAAGEEERQRRAKARAAAEAKRDARDRR